MSPRLPCLFYGKAWHEEVPLLPVLKMPHCFFRTRQSQHLHPHCPLIILVSYEFEKGEKEKLKF